MKAAFSFILNRLLEREGLIANHPSDYGGYTFKGITLGTLSRYLGGPATSEMLASLSDEEIHEIYHRLFWLDDGLDRVYLVSPVIAEFMFDWNVHSGNRGIRKVQSFIGVTPDGEFGPVSRAKLTEELQKQGLEKFYNSLCDYRIRYHIRRCQEDNSQIVFMLGWFNRVSKLRYLIHNPGL